jgi:hypothetical protein
MKAQPSRAVRSCGLVRAQWVGWVVVDADGDPRSIGDTRSEAIDRAASLQIWPWKTLYRDGWRARKAHGGLRSTVGDELLTPRQEPSEKEGA